MIVKAGRDERSDWGKATIQVTKDRGSTAGVAQVTEGSGSMTVTVGEGCSGWDKATIYVTKDRRSTAGVAQVTEGSGSMMVTAVSGGSTVSGKVTTRVTSNP